MKTENGESADRGQVLGSGLAVFECQVLVFPLLVVFLACASFLFGGRCAAWQWWAAVGAVVGVPFLKKGGWLAALVAAGLFAGLLVTVKCLLPPVFWDNVACPDMQVYHLPQIQLLIEGWNPVEDPLAKGICAKLGLDLWGMAPLHVAFLPKTMAVFAAEAYTFVGDPTALTIPGLTFLWLGVALQAMRLFRGLARWAMLAALIFLLPLVQDRMFVDLSLAFAVCGLLLTMANDLGRGGCNWLALVAWTILAMSIKFNGTLAAFVFSAGFAFVKIGRERAEWACWLGRFCLFGVFSTLAWLLISWNPLITSWQRYGHPLYPFKTVDSEKHPAADLTWDFQVVNDDYRQMGCLGGWVREYVSPTLARNYWRWKTGRNDFEARRSQTWGEYDIVGTFSSTSGKVRLVLWGLWMVLLVHPRGRVFGIGGILLGVLTPWSTIGFLRYAPWLSSLGCLGVGLLANDWSGKMPRRWQQPASLGMAIGLGLYGGVWLWHHARDMEFKARERSLHRNRVHCRFWHSGREPVPELKQDIFCPRYNYLWAMENQCSLLLKEMGKEKTTQMMSATGWIPTQDKEHLACRPLWKWDERQWFLPEKEQDVRCIEDLGPPWYEANVWDGQQAAITAEPWLRTPWDLYLVPWDANAGHIVEYWRGAEAKEGESRMGRLWRRTKWVVRVWTRMFPREAWKWLTGRAFPPQSGMLGEDDGT